MNDRRSFVKKAAILGALSAFVPEKLLANSEDIASDVKDDLKENGLIFLFQGDSITDGNRGHAEWDLNHIMGHGYAFTIASRVGADFPEKKLTFINRGISGNSVRELAGRWEQDALNLKPDVLSILVGINDSNSYLKDKNGGVSLKLYEDTYRSLLDQSKAKSPNILFVLGEPFCLPFNYDTSARTEQLQDVAARSAIVKKLAVEYNAVFVPYQQVFDTALKRAPEKYWIWDNIHPTVAGHELMAREWLKQVSKRLKFLKKEF